MVNAAPSKVQQRALAVAHYDTDRRTPRQARISRGGDSLCSAAGRSDNAGEGVHHYCTCCAVAISTFAAACRTSILIQYVCMPPSDNRDFLEEIYLRRDGAEAAFAAAGMVTAVATHTPDAPTGVVTHA